MNGRQVGVARVCCSVAVCVALAATVAYGQGLGAAAAKEKAKRERAQSKSAAPRYDNDSLERQAASASAEPGTSATPAGPATGSEGRSSDASADKEAPAALPTCGGFEMLRAWSEAHRRYAQECSGGPKAGTSGRFSIELIITATGTVEKATVTPENAYTTCVGERMRGHSMPPPEEGKRCRAPYMAMWNL